MSNEVEYRHVLEQAVQSDEGTRSANTGAAVDDDGLVIGGHAVPEAAHEANERRRRVGHSEIGPRGEMEVADDATRFALLFIVVANVSQVIN